MKILIVNTVPTERNGITNVILNLFKYFDLKDCSIDFVTINNPEPSIIKIVESRGGKVFTIPRKIKNPFKYIRQLSRLAKGYDVMHVHGNSATMILEMIAAKIADVKLRIAHSHNTSCSMHIMDNLSRPLFYALCNGRLACGKEAGKWLFRNRNFLVINNGIDTEKFRFNQKIRDSIRKNLGWNNYKIIANVANFVEAKNHEFLISVFANLCNIRSDVRLLLLGDGPLIDNAKKLADELGLVNNIHFAGAVPNVNEYLSAIDLIIMPSKFEGFPLTLVEEQANGLKAIVSDRVTKDADMTGLLSLIPLNKGTKYWAENILKILDNGIERNASCSSRSIDMIKKAGYDIHSSAQKLKNYYISKLYENK